MIDLGSEEALVALLARLKDSDDPAFADQAIELYLSRFGADHAARRYALKRLSAALIAMSELGEDDLQEASIRPRSA